MRRRLVRGVSGVNFVMAAKKIKRRFQKAFWYMTLEFREEVQCGDINLEIVSIWMAFKTKRVGEVTKCMSIDRKEKKM